MKKPQYKIERHEAPLSEDLASELIRLWQDLFQTDYAYMADVLAGKERQANTDVVYVASDAGGIVATSHLTTSRADPRLGGLGEVVTLPPHRNRGLGLNLCARAADEFDDAGGEALFLGTVNPAAARLYDSLGWRSLPNTSVMLRVRRGDDPAGFLLEYFRNGAGLPVTIHEGDNRQRITMIPLIIAPHDDWVALDANTELFSVRLMKQRSCMGLFPRYQAIGRTGKWYAATRDDGATVGLASVKRLSGDSVQVDAFSHRQFHFDVAAGLYRQAIAWAANHTAGRVQAVCAEDDKLKHSLLTQLGMRATDESLDAEGPAGPITLRIFQVQATHGHAP